MGCFGGPYGGRDVFANPWDDHQVVIGATKFAGVSDPTWAAYQGCYVLSFAKDADNILYFTAQFPHGYEFGSQTEFHIHVAYPTAGAGTTRWHFKYSWADIGATFPSQSTLSQTFTSPETQHYHALHSFGYLTTTGIDGVSSIILCSLQREGSEGDLDTYDSVLYVVGIDFHIQKDTLGSRLIATK